MLIYEGHDVPRATGGPDPKSIDQPMRTPSGGLTQNGLFYEAGKRHANGEEAADLVRVYEKLRTGIWVFTGVFRLLDAWRERSSGREVFKSGSSSLPTRLPLRPTRAKATSTKLA